MTAFSGGVNGRRLNSRKGIRAARAAITVNPFSRGIAR
jgi:hypothetical protein